jgi:DNA-binding NtrC family response regulator
MSEGRMLPLLGPALVLYLVADLAATAGELDEIAWSMIVLAGLLSLVPAFALRREARPGARRIAWMSLATSLLVVSHAHAALSLVLELAREVPLPIVGALVADLAFDVPDRPPALHRFERARRVGWVLAASCTLLACAHVLGPLPGGVVVGEALARWVPIGSIVFLAIAVALRALRRRLGSEAADLAAGSSALLGTAATLVLVLFAAVLAIARGSFEDAPVRVVLALAAIALAVGHSSIRTELRPVAAARSTRRVIAVGLVCALAGATAALAPRVPVDPIALAIVAAGMALLVTLGLAAVDALAERWLAPDGGRLIAAAAEAERACAGARDLETLGASVLPHLRTAARTLDAEPVILSIDPARAVRLDAAGMPHVETRALSPALIDRFGSRRGEIVVRAPIEAQVVRRPELRALAEALEALDALAVVPLMHDGELDGALVVPRGRRRGALTIEELAALEVLASRIAPVVGLVGAAERSRRREGELMSEREQLEERLDALEDELSRSRAEAARTKESAGGPSAAPIVAYGPAMRAAVARVDELAALDAPVLFAFEPGVSAAPLVRRLHEGGSRKTGPIVVADCANVRSEEAELALFGDELRHGTPGWLRSAAGGTLFLDRATALGTDVLRQLDDAIATRSARPVGFGAPYAIDVRVVLGVHDDPAALVERSSMDSGLAERVRAMRVELPPLRARPEDLGSLVLFAIDRACRASGSAVLGIADDALAELAAHDWPGNELELFALIERAVRRASPPRITKADVGSLVVRAAAPLDGSLADIERRALETALARAGGNKSEAARLLGIARTTFLDKLKRAGIEVPDERRSTRPPPAERPSQTPPGKNRRTSAA